MVLKISNLWGNGREGGRGSVGDETNRIGSEDVADEAGASQPEQSFSATEIVRKQRELEEAALQQGAKDVGLALEAGAFICRLHSTDQRQVLMYWEGVATALVKIGEERLRDIGVDLLRRVNTAGDRGDLLMTDDLIKQVDEVLFGTEDPTVKVAI